MIKIFYEQVVVIKEPDFSVDSQGNVDYRLCGLPLAKIMGLSLSMHYLGKRFCGICGRRMNKEQYETCFYCNRNSLLTDLCIVKPTLCHFSKGTCRQELIATKLCFSEFTVYLSYTSNPKVGITRTDTLEKRWVRQGAIYGLPIFTTDSRMEAGCVEHELLRYVKDKTVAKKMLTLTRCQYERAQKEITQVHEAIDNDYTYPSYAHKVAEPKLRAFYYSSHATCSAKLDISHIQEQKIIGMKGSYLLLEGGYINLMKHRGRLCRFVFYNSKS